MCSVYQKGRQKSVVLSWQLPAKICLILFVLLRVKSFNYKLKV